MKKEKLSTITLILVLLTGLSLLLYPTVSDYWNSLHQTRAVTNYVDEVIKLDDNRYQAVLDSAKAYNTELLARYNRYRITEAEEVAYNAQLNVSTSGTMGYIEIPSIEVTLPIYHGISDSALQKGIGHIPWSSLPVGGKSTHCVLSGHRGLPSSKLFSDLDKVVEGDIFILQVLNETLTYQVDQIRIVEPAEIDTLEIVSGQDYCTLVTCTPYGINSHRLLVRGRRVSNQQAPVTIRITADAMLIEPQLVAVVVAIPMLLILLVVLLATTGKKNRRQRNKAET